MVVDEPSNILGVMLLLAQGADATGGVNAAANASSIASLFLFYAYLLQSGF
jgi:hypothetical protein